MHATEAEIRLKEAEQWKGLLAKNTKDLAKTIIDLLKVIKRMNEDCSSQEDRFINMEE